MTSLTPHRDAVEAVIARANEAQAALEPAVSPSAQLERRVCHDVVSALLRAYGDAKDQDVDESDLLTMAASSVAGALISLALTLAEGDRDHARPLFDMLVEAVHGNGHRTMGGSADISVSTRAVSGRA